MRQFADSSPGHLSEEMRLEGSLCNCSAAFMESVTNRKAVPLPLGEGSAKRRVRSQVCSNLETLTLPSPGRGGDGSSAIPIGSPLHRPPLHWL